MPLSLLSMSVRPARTSFRVPNGYGPSGRLRSALEAARAFALPAALSLHLANDHQMTPPLFAGASRAFGPCAPLTAARLSGTPSAALRPKASRLSRARQRVIFLREMRRLPNQGASGVGFPACPIQGRKFPFPLVSSRSTSPGYALSCKPRVVSSAHPEERGTARGVGYPTRRLFPKAERDGLRRVARPKGRGATLSAGGASGSELIARWRVHRAFAREHGDATERGNGGRGRRRGNAVSHNAPAFPRREGSPLEK